MALSTDKALESFYRARGDARAEQRQFARALMDYNKAIQLNPEDAMAYMNHGNACGAQGEVKVGVADHDRAIELDPKLALAYANRCWACLRLGNDSMQERIFRNASNSMTS